MLDQGRVYIGHLGPIPLYLHWSFLFLILMAFNWAPPTSSAGLSHTLLVLIVLVSGIILHEMGHGMAARIHGAFGVTITLWGLGGVCSSVRDPLPRRELLILAAGPAVSALLAWGSQLAFQGLAGTAPHLLYQGHELTLLGEFLILAKAINWMLFIFNMIPIYPLDGGQMTYYLALLVTRRQAIAARFSLTLACLGAFAYLWWRSNGFTDLQGGFIYSLILIGWLLYSAFTNLRR